jgi:hypothetical protein
MMKAGVRGAGPRGELQMNVDRNVYSRYQVICAECEAWTEGDGARTATYFYDGISFWRRDPNGKGRVVPSWRTPGHGWKHSADCPCELCESRRPVPIHGLSVA